MKTGIVTTGKAVDLDVTYLATLYKDEPTTEEGEFLNGITEVEVQIKGDGIDLVRYYWSTGQFRPSASEARLTSEENMAIFNGVKELFREYGSTDSKA